MDKNIKQLSHGCYTNNILGIKNLFHEWSNHGYIPDVIDLRALCGKLVNPATVKLVLESLPQGSKITNLLPVFRVLYMRSINSCLREKARAMLDVLIEHLPYFGLTKELSEMINKQEYVSKQREFNRLLRSRYLDLDAIKWDCVLSHGCSAEVLHLLKTTTKETSHLHKRMFGYGVFYNSSLELRYYLLCEVDNDVIVSLSFAKDRMLYIIMNHIEHGSNIVLQRIITLMERYPEMDFSRKSCCGEDGYCLGLLDESKDEKIVGFLLKQMPVMRESSCFLKVKEKFRKKEIFF